MVKPDIGGKAAPVSFRNVSKVYGGDVKAVDDVSLEVETVYAGSDGIFR
jgi:hypothetical protein